MNKTKSLLIGLALALTATSANALILDFKSLANVNEYGVQPLTIGTMTVNGLYNNGANTGYAYLDGAWGGLGVCKTLDLNNQCDPANDDNVTLGESLRFIFGSDVTIKNIWFNNNHDGDQSLLGDTINIGGSNYTFNAADQTNVAGVRSDWLYSNLIDITAGTNFDISFVDNPNNNDKNENFYITAIEFTVVPEPAILGMLALGLIGIGFAQRKRS